MEKKTTKYNNTSSLILYSIKNKKSWLILSTILIFVTTILVPYLLNTREEFFILFGIVEVFILVYLNCLIDNNFLHSDSKLAYYKSKPVSLKKQITINIITNIIYTGFLLFLIFLSMHFQRVDNDMFSSFKIIIPWLLTGIFLASLSSILSGNTIMAGAMTIFNFCLPLIIYLIIFFVFTILENIVIGFSANILMNYFTEKIFKLNYIYFVEYSNNSVDIIYIIVLGVILTFIGILINRFIERRKNENTGNFIVFDGFKYFVSVLASLIIPASFTIMSYSQGIWSKLTASLILAVLTYYIIIALIEKSFRISLLSAKVFSVSIIAFALITGGTIFFANQYKDDIPNAEDVNFAYIGTNIYISNTFHMYGETYDKNDYSYLNEWQKNTGAILFSEKENIDNITKLHREILNNQQYNNIEQYYYNNLRITYWMNDGRVITRDYKIRIDDETFENNKNMDDLADKIINSQETKKRKYFYLYDEEYVNSNKIICYISPVYNEEIIIDNINIDELRPHLIKDLNEIYTNVDNPFQLLLSYGYNYYEDKGIGTGDYDLIFEEINNVDNNRQYRLNINSDFKNTLEYLNLK